MPDQVEARLGAIRQRGALRLELLHVVLAEFAQPQFVGFSITRGRKFLSDREQHNIRTLAACARGRIRNSVFNLL